MRVASIAFLLVLAGCLEVQIGDAPADERAATFAPAPPPVAPTAHFSWRPEAPRVGDVVTFEAKAQPEGGKVATGWEWHWGQGEPELGRVASHRFMDADFHSVTLLITFGDGTQKANVREVFVYGRGEPVPTTPAPAADETQADRPYDEALPVLRFRAPSIVVDGSGRSAGEPSLAIDSRGNYYVSPPGTLSKSEDDGQTWRPLRYPLSGVLGNSGDSHVVVDPEGRLYQVDLSCHGVQHSCSTSAYSTVDDGATWTGSSFASATPAFNDRPWVAALGGGVAYVKYYLAAYPGGLGLGEGDQFIVKTVDGGSTWTPLASFHPNDGQAFLFVDRQDGTLYAVQANRLRGSGVQIFVSKDGGQSFSTHEVASTSGPPGNIFVTGATDEAGNVYVAWVSKETDRFDVWMSWSKDKGATWNAPALVTTEPGTRVFPWIAAAGEGKVLMAWYGTEAVGDPNTLPAETAWEVYAAQSTNGLGASPSYSTVRVTTDPVHTGAICTHGSGCTGDRDLLDFLMAQITPDGRAVIVYANDGSSDVAAALLAVQDGGPRFR